jgi:hypothetical protein
VANRFCCRSEFDFFRGKFLWLGKKTVELLYFISKSEKVLSPVTGSFGSLNFGEKT